MYAISRFNNGDISHLREGEHLSLRMNSGHHEVRTLHQLGMRIRLLFRISFELTLSVLCSGSPKSYGPVICNFCPSNDNPVLNAGQARGVASDS